MLTAPGGCASSVGGSEAVQPTPMSLGKITYEVGGFLEVRPVGRPRGDAPPGDQAELGRGDRRRAAPVEGPPAASRIHDVLKLGLGRDLLSLVGYIETVSTITPTTRSYKQGHGPALQGQLGYGLLIVTPPTPESQLAQHRRPQSIVDPMEVLVCVGNHRPRWRVVRTIVVGPV